MTNKRCKLTDRQIINLFNRKRPQSIEDVEKLGINLKGYDSGIDREVYRVGRWLVMKLDYDTEQTRNEVKVIKKIHTKKKYRSLRKHVPKLLYASRSRHITLTYYYPGQLNEYDQADLDNINYFKELVIGILGVFNDCDMHDGNFRYDRNGNIVCVDLGMESI